jgi:hypothetical protein
VLAGCLLALAPGAARGQASDTGAVSRLSFGGDSSDAGQIYRLDPSVGYRFSRHLSVSTGIPVFFVRPSSNTTATGATSQSGIGNAYVDLKLETERSGLYFGSTLRGNAPTGDADRGFSTGRATFDWNNYLSKEIGSITPFGSAGVANTVSDTHFFSRPFTSLGNVVHFEGGAELSLHHGLSVGGSGYAIVPSGEQKLYSKLVKRTPPGQVGKTNPGRGKAKQFESESVVIGGEEIARDHGASVWVGLSPTKHVSFELGYSRSVLYDYNSVFFNVGFDLGQIVRAGRR